MPLFSPEYVYAMTASVIAEKWPDLKSETFRFTSEQTPLYNCIAWAIGENDKWIDAWYFQEVFELDPENVDHSVDGYAKYLENYGFERCEDSKFEKDFLKIVIYADEVNDFTHAVRLLESNKWTSKMGDYEDIEHNNLTDIAGKFYGNPTILMKKKIESLS